MKLEELTIQNFLSFGKEEKINLSEVGLYLICGPNGSGKSTILDALTFAFYGQTVRPINLPKIVNEQVQENCKVGLKFDINGTKYWIERYRKHEKYKDSLRIYKGTYDDAGLFSKADSKDAQEQLNDIIKMNYKAFINTIMLTQEDIAGFIESNPAKKKEIIESVLQLDSFNQYHKIAQDKRKLKKKALDVISMDIKSSEKIIDQIKKTMEDYIVSCKQQKVSDKETVAELKEELKLLREINVEEEYKKIQDAKTLKETKNNLSLEIEKIQSEIELKNKEIDTIENSNDEYNDLIKKSNNRIKKDGESKKSYQSKIDALTQEIKESQDNPERCPLCNGEINIETHQKFINDKKQELDSINQLFTNIDVNVANEQKSIKEWEAKIADNNSKIDFINNEKTQKTNNIKKINNEINAIVIPETKNENDLKEKSEKIKEIETKIDSYSKKEYIDKNYVDRSKNALIKSMEELKEFNEKFQTANKEYILLQFWEDSLSSKKNSIKSWCINNIVGYFNTRIKYYIDRFFEGDISIQFDNELNELVQYKGYDRDFKQFSGGQRRRLNIAILFALHSLVKANVSNKIDIMFLDEVLSNYLDDKGISIVLILLEEMKDNKESVWVIDHRENFKNFSAFKRVEVSLDKKNFSHITI